MMYWNTHPDGSMTRKLVADWSEEEKALDLRRKAFLKEATDLGFVFRLDIHTLQWVGAYQDERLNSAAKAFLAQRRQWVGLTDEEIVEGQRESWVDKQAWESAVWWAEAKLKEKNT